jgi:hypothetical protein
MPLIIVTAAAGQEVFQTGYWRGATRVKGSAAVDESGPLAPQKIARAGATDPSGPVDSLGRQLKIAPTKANPSKDGDAKPRAYVR